MKLRGEVVLSQVKDKPLSFLGYMFVWLLVLIVAYFLDSIIALVLAYLIISEIGHMSVSHPPNVNQNYPAYTEAESKHENLRAFAMFCVSVLWWLINRDSIGMVGSVIGLVGMLYVFPTVDRAFTV